MVKRLVSGGSDIYSIYIDRSSGHDRIDCHRNNSIEINETMNKNAFCHYKHMHTNSTVMLRPATVYS